jgi:hypothetical protein
MSFSAPLYNPSSTWWSTMRASTGASDASSDAAMRLWSLRNEARCGAREKRTRARQHANERAHVVCTGSAQRTDEHGAREAAVRSQLRDVHVVRKQQRRNVHPLALQQPRHLGAQRQVVSRHGDERKRAGVALGAEQRRVREGARDRVRVRSLVAEHDRQRAAPRQRGAGGTQRLVLRRRGGWGGA